MNNPSGMSSLVGRIEEILASPVFFSEVLGQLSDAPYRLILEAWSEIRTKHHLNRDIHGRYWIGEAQV